MCSLVLVMGGAASGKSALGEGICSDRGGRLLYIAAMRPFGEEAMARVSRHQRIRAGKGFETLERYQNLETVKLQGHYDAVLLECMGNLTANEMFDASVPEEELPDKILAGVERVMGFAGTLVVITNDVFAGAEQYEGEMAAYLRCLAAINRKLAARADVVIEAVAGLPLALKGETALCEAY